jgi:hypothetical protein
MHFHQNVFSVQDDVKLFNIVKSIKVSGGYAKKWNHFILFIIITLHHNPKCIVLYLITILNQSKKGTAKPLGLAGGMKFSS